MPRLPDIIGLPPIAQAESLGPFNHTDLVIDSMTVIELWPALPQWTTSLQGYRLISAWDKYKSDLGSLGGYSYIGTGNKIKVAVLSDNPPTESFNNSFGESVLTSMINAASEGMREVYFKTGGKTVADIAGSFANSDNSLMKGLGEGALKAGSGAKGLAQGLGEAAGFTKEQVNSSIDVLMNTMHGAKMDYAHVWKTADFAPNYSCNVRLYNPWPANTEAHECRIIGPLAALLLFVVPISEDGESFTWPFMCKFRIPGIVNTYAGYIRSMSVVKGGDDYSVSYNQRPGIVDVKIDFGILYSVMLNQRKTSGAAPDIPTLKTYLEELRSGKNIKPSSYSVSPHRIDSKFHSSTSPGMDFFKTPRNTDPKDRNDINSRTKTEAEIVQEILDQEYEAQSRQSIGLLESAQRDMNLAKALFDEASLSNDPILMDSKIQAATIAVNRANMNTETAKSLAVNISEAHELDNQAKILAEQSAVLSDLSYQQLELSLGRAEAAKASSSIYEKLQHTEGANGNITQGMIYNAESQKKMSGVTRSF